MNDTDKELLDYWTTLLEERKQINEVIKEIKIQRQNTINNPNTGNLVSLICWYDSLLARIERKVS